MIFTHLIDQCITFDNSFEQIRNISEILTPYATAFRYPGDVLEPNFADAEEALRLAGDLLDFVRKKVPDEVKEK